MSFILVFYTDGCYIDVYKDGGIVSDLDYVGTGMTVEVKSGVTVVSSYNVVIYGDINGDGYINLRDLIRLKKYIHRTILISDSYLEAANTNRDLDGIVDVMDLLILKKNLLNIELINQNY